jgi:hypothetical protein
MTYQIPNSGNHVMFDFITLRVFSQRRTELKPLLESLAQRIAGPLREQSILAIINEAAQAWDKHLVPTIDLSTFLLTVPKGSDMLPPDSFTEFQAEEWLIGRKSRPEIVPSLRGLFNATFWEQHAPDFGGSGWSETLDAWHAAARGGEDLLTSMSVMYSKIHLLENLISLKVTPDAINIRRKIIEGKQSIDDVVRYCSMPVARAITGLS